MQMRILLVANQQSGSSDEVDVPARLREHGAQVELVDIGEACDWDAQTARTRGDGIERVVVAGGDGSIGPAARVASWLGVPLAVAPAGTANDFARAMQLPDDLEAAIEVAAAGQRERPVDLAEIDGTPFMNIASVGIAPHAAEQARSLKSRLRSLAYPVGAALAMARARPVSVVARVDGDLVWSGKAWQAMVASTGAFGGWADTGTARPGDGNLDLVVVPAGRGTKELVFDAAALLSGELATRDGVHHQRGRSIELTLHRAPRVVVDGELVEVGDRHVLATVTPPPVRVIVG